MYTTASLVLAVAFIKQPPVLSSRAKLIANLNTGSTLHLGKAATSLKSHFVCIQWLAALHRFNRIQNKTG